MRFKLVTFLYLYNSTGKKQHQMDIEQFRTYCLNKPYTTEELPFDDVTLVFKIAGQKIFAITPLDEANQCNLKCNPERALELRAQYMGIQPGFHMNKKHWNTVHFNEDADDALVEELIDHSYDLVYRGLPQKIKKAYPI